MMKYKDAHWEWHLAQEIIDAYNKEKAFKDSLCSVESSVDDSTESFLAVLLNEIDMSQQKLKVIYLKTWVGTCFYNNLFCFFRQQRKRIIN